MLQQLELNSRQLAALQAELKEKVALIEELQYEKATATRVSMFMIIEGLKTIRRDGSPGLQHPGPTRTSKIQILKRNQHK